MSRSIVFYHEGSEISVSKLGKLIDQNGKKLSSSAEILIDTGRSRLLVIKNFTPDYFDHFRNLKLDLIHEPPIVVFGKQCNQRRNVRLFSNDSTGYGYSSQTIKSLQLEDDVMIGVMNKVNENLGTKFNGILVNEYTDGTKTVGAHADNEDGLDKIKSCVAGIAYGATRIFRVRDMITNEIVLDHNHDPCSLIVMDGDFQKEFKHEIPQQKKIKDCRISLTFRNHIK